MRSLKEQILDLLEKDREFRLAVGSLVGYKEILNRLAEHDRKFNEVLSEIRDIREKLNSLEGKMDELSARVEVTIGSMGRRWGTDLERTILRIFQRILEERGIDPNKVRKFRFKDTDGSITGYKGRIVDIDILAEDSHLYIMEVKSTFELDQVEYLIEKAKFVEAVLGRKVDKIFIIAVNIDRDAYERAKELGIEVIYGHVLELPRRGD